MKHPCRARRTNGQPCRNNAIRGAVVCRIHGGSAKQVRAKARERLEQMVEPALVALRRLIDQADSDAVKLAAIRDVLDRCGYKLPERLELDSSGKLVVEVELVDRPLPSSTTHGTHQNGHVAAFGP